MGSLELSRRTDCLRYRTGGQLVGRRSSRRLCRGYERRPVASIVYRQLVRLGVARRVFDRRHPLRHRQASGTIDVVVRGGDGALWQKEYNNGGWGSLGSLSAG